VVVGYSPLDGIWLLCVLAPSQPASTLALPVRCAEALIFHRDYQARQKSAAGSRPDVLPDYLGADEGSQRCQ
jgi:hypothetical protein